MLKKCLQIDEGEGKEINEVAVGDRFKVEFIEDGLTTLYYVIVDKLISGKKFHLHLSHLYYL